MYNGRGKRVTQSILKKIDRVDKKTKDKKSCIEIYEKVTYNKNKKRHGNINPQSFLEHFETYVLPAYKEGIS